MKVNKGALQDSFLTRKFPRDSLVFNARRLNCMESIWYWFSGWLLYSTTIYQSIFPQTCSLSYLFYILPILCRYTYGTGQGLGCGSVQFYLSISLSSGKPALYLISSVSCQYCVGPPMVLVLRFGCGTVQFYLSISLSSRQTDLYFISSILCQYCVGPPMVLV